MKLNWHKIRNRLRNFPPHIFLVFYSLISLFPIILIVMNSFKERKAIFKTPYLFPTVDTFSLKGYETLFERASFEAYFLNSFIVVAVSMFLILLFGAMAAYALAEYDFPGNPILGLYLAIGIMIPIRLGTIGILRLVVKLGLMNTLTALILVYIAQGLPMAIFILTQFMKAVPKELKDAGRVDGASEYRIFWLVVPLVRPALAAVAIFTVLPIWNDLWFPLILANSEKTKTVTLGAQVFLGQFVIDWNAVLSSLTLSMVPVLLLYLIFAKNLIKNITAGAVK